MTVWEYAQLTVTYKNRSATDDATWEIAWHCPDVAIQDTAETYGDVVATLNRAGKGGWELRDVATLDAGDSGHLSGTKDWSLTRYTFRRLFDPIYGYPSTYVG